MSIVGFDIGSTTSTACFIRGGKIEIALDEDGSRSVPTVVALHPERRSVGQEAQRDPSACTNLKAWTTDYARGVQLYTSMLGKLKRVVEAALSPHIVCNCVVSVPSSWTSARRRVVLTAGQLAGLQIVRLVNDSVATALQYGIPKSVSTGSTRTVLFVDAGHTQIQASIVEFTPTGMLVLSHNWSAAGGATIDRLLAKHLHDRVSAGTDDQVVIPARECRRVKHVLSANQETQSTYEGARGDVAITVCRSDLESICQADVLQPLERLLEASRVHSGLEWTGLDAVELVGGTACTPCVQGTVRRVTGHAVSRTCDGTESVAKGCALLCAIMSPACRVRSYSIGDIQPHEVTATWGGDGRSETLMGRFDSVPMSADLCGAPDTADDVTIRMGTELVCSAVVTGTASLHLDHNLLVGIHEGTSGKPVPTTDAGALETAQLQRLREQEGVYEVERCARLEQESAYNSLESYCLQLLHDDSLRRYASETDWADVVAQCSLVAAWLEEVEVQTSALADITAQTARLRACSEHLDRRRDSNQALCAAVDAYRADLETVRREYGDSVVLAPLYADADEYARVVSLECVPGETPSTYTVEQVQTASATVRSRCRDAAAEDPTTTTTTARDEPCDNPCDDPGGHDARPDRVT